MRACHVKGLYFYKHFANKSAILDLSILFKTNYPEIISRNKTLSSKFLCEEDKFLSISKQKKKSVLLFQQKVFGREFSCPYKSSIL